MSETLLDAPAATEAPATETPATEAPPIVSTEADRDWSGALNADGSFDAKAHEYGVPEQFKSLGGVLESYKELQRMKGAPGEEATPEQLSAFREAHGIPEVANAESYGIELPEALKEVYKPESINEIVKVANESAHLGHTGMLKAVIAKFSEMEVAGMQEMESATAEQQAQVLAERAKQLEQNPNFTGDRKAAALQTSANALNAALGALGVDANSEEAKEVARSPLMVQILHHYGSKTGQDSTNLGNASTDLRSGEEQANDIISNPNNPDYEAYHAGNETVGKRVLALMAGA